MYQRSHNRPQYTGGGKDNGQKINPIEKVRFRYANSLMIDMDRIVW